MVMELTDEQKKERTKALLLLAIPHWDSEYSDDWDIDTAVETIAKLWLDELEQLRQVIAEREADDTWRQILGHE